MATTGLWDISGSSNSLPSGQRNQTSTESGNSTVNEKSTQTGTQFTSQQNTPQFSLDAMEALINQLMDRPAISDAELDRLAPLPRLGDYANYTSQGFAGYDLQRYHRDLNNANARRAQIQEEGGMIEGGTAQQLEERKMRTGEIKRVRRAQAGYSREAALSDANATTAKFARQLMEQLMPNIRNAMDSSGTSGGAVSGLMANDAAARVAEAQAALSIDAVAKYGQIFSGLENEIVDLLGQQDPVLQALLQALNISKGTVNQGVSTGTQTTDSTKQVTTDKTDKTQINQTGNAGKGTGTTTTSLTNGPNNPSQKGQSPVNYAGAVSLDDISNLLGSENPRIRSFSFG